MDRTQRGRALKILYRLVRPAQAVQHARQPGQCLDMVRPHRQRAFKCAGSIFQPAVSKRYPPLRDMLIERVQPANREGAAVESN